MENFDDPARAAVYAALRAFFAANHGAKAFIPGKTPVPVSGRVYDERDMLSLADSAMDFWLTSGRFTEGFERRFAKRLGLTHSLLVNSGSSANLLAVSALTSPSLGDKALKPGDEVLTVAAGFPTTVNPILQVGAVPVFVDIEFPTYNADMDALERAVGPKTKAIMLAHTLGNPFDAARAARIAEDRGLWLIEDCCDALGATLNGKPAASFGDLATFSFYPAHHITTGEGGAVATSNGRLQKLLESFRDWGRDCWCPTGKDNTCGKRFDWQLGGLPAGYDHKYIYSHLGYNLKATDMQAAVGLSQLDKLNGFIAARRRNFQALLTGLRPFEDRLVLPAATPGSEPSWFGFPLTVKKDAGFTRNELTAFLEQRKIATRLLFAGDLTRQPYFKGRPHRVEGSLVNTDRVMRDTFWIGVYPGITQEMIAYVVETFASFFAARGPRR